MNTRHVVAIIPAFNEEPTVGAVVQVLKSSPLVSEVIVVSDGSTDATVRVAQVAGATVYEIPNGGKGAAMLYGLAHTHAEIILFCDADLRGFTTQHVEQLVAPVLSGKLAMCVGLRDKGTVLNQLTKHLPLIGGERVLSRSIMEAIPPKHLSGFMVESALNYYCRSHHLFYDSVRLAGLSMRRKFEKIGWRRAIGQYVKMSWQVGKAMFIVRLCK